MWHKKVSGPFPGARPINGTCSGLVCAIHSIGLPPLLSSWILHDRRGPFAPRPFRPTVVYGYRMWLLPVHVMWLEGSGGSDRGGRDMCSALHRTLGQALVKLCVAEAFESGM